MDFSFHSGFTFSPTSNRNLHHTLFNADEDEVPELIGILPFFSYFIFYTEFSIPFFESDTINNYLSTLNKIKSNIIKILLVIIHTYIFTSGLFFFYDTLLNLYYRSRFWFPSEKINNQIVYKYEKFEINLSQDDLKEIDVLKRISKEMLIYWKGLDSSKFLSYNRNIYILWMLLINTIKKHSESKGVDELYNDIFRSLLSLNQRINAQVTAQNEINVTPNLSIGVAKAFSRLALPLGKLSSKESMTYPIASSKEIEDELIDIFKKINKLGKRLKSKSLPGFI